jgi:hypothetical protein
MVFNSSITQSTLAMKAKAKKHNAICFHRMREAVASGMIRVAKVQLEFNLADGFMKSLPTPCHHFILTRLMLNPQWTDGESAMTFFVDEDLCDNPNSDMGMPMESEKSDDKLVRLWELLMLREILCQ